MAESQRQGEQLELFGLMATSTHLPYM